MRGQGMALAVALLGLSAPARAQSAETADEPRTAEEFIATAREAYAVDEPEPEQEPCATPTAAEIVVCRQVDRPSDQSLPSPTERANAAGERPPDPIPSAPDVFGLPPCSSYAFCAKMGRAPPPIYIADLSKIPEPLTPEEAARVVRAEDLPEDPPTPEAASPAAAP
jgi:hypothetical protein